MSGDYDFDYVFFYSTTDELNDKLDDIIEGTKDIENGDLFKIEKVNNSIILRKEN